MSFSKILYLANDDQLDRLVYKNIVPFFRSKSSFESKSLCEESSFEKYDSLTSNVKRIFRDLVYEQYNDLECSKEEFFMLYEFLNFVDYNKKEFLPLYRRYIYNNRDDKEFLLKSAYIHRDRQYLGFTLKELYCYLLGIEPTCSLEEVKSLADKGIPDAIHLYASCLRYGIGGDENKVEARRLYRLNWEENKHSDSLNNYASCLRNGIGGDENKVEARRLFKLNWEENKNSDSLCRYALCLIMGIGGPQDEVEARRLYKLNWEKNKDISSLYDYAVCLRYGIGGDENKVEADRLMAIYNSLTN